MLIPRGTSCHGTSGDTGDPFRELQAETGAGLCRFPCLESLTEAVVFEYA